MKFLNQCAAVGLAATLLASCSEENPWGATSGEGTLHLRIEANSDVEAAVPAVRAISETIPTPPASAFQVSMVKEAGGYSKTWASMDEFSKEESFPVGNYTLSISYGDETSQGQVLPNEMGYEHAYFYGETDVTIKEGQDTEVHLTAALQNAVVVIEYTDEFKNFFPEYHTIVQPAGGEAIDLGNNEAMNFVQPGDLNITIAATQQNGMELVLNPATFTVEGQHMYKLCYNIYNGEIGNTVLSIEFDESLTTEPVTVNLSDELLNTRAPQVTLIGPDQDQTLAYAPGAPYTGDAKFSIVADGGMEAAVLTISSDDSTFKPSFLSENNDIDLCAATPAQQKALEDAGIKCIGFFGNRSTMAEVDLSGFFDKLPKGKCGFSFYVRDQYSQTSVPVGFSMAAIPVEKSAVCDDGAPFAENYVDIIVGYNGPEPTINAPFSFQITRASGIDQNIDVLSVETSDAPKTRADEYPVKYYKYRLSLPEIDEILKKDAFEIRVLFNNVSKDAMVVPVNVVYPQHTMTYDAMAKQLRWRVSFPGVENKENSEALKEAYMSRLRVFMDGAAITSTYDSDIEAYVITGLTPDKSYNLQTSMQIASTPSEFATSADVSTEAAAAVPNGDFENLTETINKELQQGGGWSSLSSWAQQYTKETYNVSEPNGWASVNAKTCNLNASTINTWFVVPSTYNVGDAHSGNTAMAIRSVGYSYSGTVPSRSTHTDNTNYSTKTPGDNPDHKAAGKLFLGSYRIDTSSLTETYSQGVSFTGRPTSFSGYYKYTPQGDDKGMIKIEILDGTNVFLSKTVEVESQANWTKFDVPIPKYAFGSKISTLKIMIASSNKASESYAEEDNSILVTPITKFTQKYLGSELIIDNLTFEY